MVAFDDGKGTAEHPYLLAELQMEYLIEMENAVVVIKNGAGMVRLHQAPVPTVAGAISGGFRDLLAGMISVNPVPGLTVGSNRGEGLQRTHPGSSCS